MRAPTMAPMAMLALAAGCGGTLTLEERGYSLIDQATFDARIAVNILEENPRNRGIKYLFARDRRYYMTTQANADDTILGEAGGRFTFANGRVDTSWERGTGWGKEAWLSILSNGTEFRCIKGWSSDHEVGFDTTCQIRTLPYRPIDDQFRGFQPALNNPDCAVWVPRNYVITWDGSCVDGKAEGAGSSARRHGTDEGTYEGDMVGGKRHGYGILVWDQRRYEGPFADDRKSGFGVEVFDNGSRYDGEFLDGEPHGRGTFEWVNGDRFEGDYRGGEREGSGVATWITGDRYDGEYRSDMRDGRGVYVWASGNRYEGDFVDNARTGQGTCTWVNGDRYEGGFVEGERSGAGILVRANGEVLDGQWRKGRFQSP